jgi:hypothetical protein
MKRSFLVIIATTEQLVFHAIERTRTRGSAGSCRSFHGSTSSQCDDSEVAGDPERRRSATV